MLRLTNLFFFSFQLPRYVVQSGSPTYTRAQEDSVEKLVASSPPGIWGMFSDCLTRHIDLRAPKPAVLGRQQGNSVEDGVQYIRLGGLKTSRRCFVLWTLTSGISLYAPFIAKWRGDLLVRSSSLTSLQMAHGYDIRPL